MKTKRIAIAALAAMMVASVGIAPAVSAKCTDGPTRVTVEGAKIKTEEPELTGYKFAGWYTDSALTKKLSNSTLKIYDGEVITLYPKMVPIKYTINFKVNAPDGATVTSKSKYSKTVKYDHKVKLTNKFSVKGYKFTGWNTKADGTGVDYKNKEKVKNLRSHEGDTRSLYAQWTLKAYTITYKLAGGKNNSKNKDTYTIKSKTMTLKKAYKEGYTFLGWCDEDGNKVTKIKKGSTGDITLYAVYASKVDGKYLVAADGVTLADEF